jgi:hypothetical protein
MLEGSKDPRWVLASVSVEPDRVVISGLDRLTPLLFPDAAIGDDDKASDVCVVTLGL